MDYFLLFAKQTWAVATNPALSTANAFCTTLDNVDAPVIDFVATARRSEEHRRGKEDPLE